MTKRLTEKLMTKSELLGTVTAPSGNVLIVDMGMLNLWCHDREPVMPEGMLSDEAATASANAARDFKIEGPDAEAAGRAFERQWHPRFVYDIPEAGFAEVQESFDNLVRARGLRAQLVAQQSRVSHLARVPLAIEAGRGAGEVQFHGIPAVAVAGLPKARAFRVVGERMGEGDFPDRWRWVTLEVRPEERIHESVEVSSVGVDWARLMFIDVDSLSAWRHEEAADGKADFLFWGRDAEHVAAKTNAPRVSPSVFGWTDLDIDTAVERGTAIEGMKSPTLKFATDFRPHSDHYRLLEQMRASATESGTHQVGAAKCCAFFTLWGDGFFPVWVDLNEQREVVQVRINLGTETAIRNLQSVNR